jgi:hypothetical protein
MWQARGANITTRAEAIGRFWSAQSLDLQVDV